jgi:K+-transporting ATPase A subunit
MNQNMGSTDRIVRIIIAVILAALYFMGTVSGTLGIIFLIIAAVFLLTSLLGWCPLYLPFKLSTKKQS